MRLAALLVLTMVLAAGSGVRADPVTPYTDPLFAAECTFHHFAEGEAPPITGLPDDPLCVEYDKRDITATDGGAIRFLAAEPARFAVAVPKCRYWQQDHWSVQVAPGTTAIVRWDGSYWFDKGNGTGGARLRNFAIGGQPAGPEQAADLIAPLDPDLAAVMRRYGEGAGGGGGATFCLGFREPSCAAAETPLGCGGNPGDACAVATARADADAACDCTTARRHGAYVACVARVADDEIEGGQLPAACKATVERCASRSTCGRTGHVTCCRTSTTGATTCAVKRSAASCRAPRGGRACVGARASCCDACGASGCS